MSSYFLLVVRCSDAVVPAADKQAQDFKAVISNPHMRVFQNGSLAVGNVHKKDAGSYLCQVSNGVGPGLSKVVLLTVNGQLLGWH